MPHLTPLRVVRGAVLFTAFAFDGSDEMTVDEVTLALKTAAVGLSKLAQEPPPLESEVAAVAADVSARPCVEATRSTSHVPGRRLAATPARVCALPVSGV